MKQETTSICPSLSSRSMLLAFVAFNRNLKPLSGEFLEPTMFESFPVIRLCHDISLTHENY